MSEQRYDIVIVGGGVMGCAIAYALLKADPQLGVAVVERDPDYAYASTPLSDGNTRVQFNLRENILMSLYGLEVMARFADDMAVEDERPELAFRRQGNLFIVDEQSRAECEQGLALQQSLGGDVAWLAPEAVRAAYPLLGDAAFVGGTLGSQDGTLSPLAVLHGYRRKAQALGAHFVAAEVAAVLRYGNAVAGVRLVSGAALAAEVVVNAAGAWAAALARTAGVDLPVVPTKREVTVVETAARPDGILPLVFFPSGLYVIHEGAGLFMCGKSFADDYIGVDDFRWERGRFEERVWPELAEWLPSFDRLKVLRGWAGLYEVNTLDGNAILGEWPTLRGFWLANGFSGHGFQQCHAVGRYLAERIRAVPPTLDLAAFGPQRILDNNPIRESYRKII